MEIGKMIASRRRERNISQEKLSERAEISQGYISSIERGKEKPSLELLEKIAQALDCQLYIDLIPNGSAVTLPEEERPFVPTWVTLEKASTATIFSIALEKLKIEKETMTSSELKTVEGLIETCREVIER